VQFDAMDIHWLCECFWSIVKYQRMDESDGLDIAVKVEGRPMQFPHELSWAQLGLRSDGEGWN